MTSVESLSSLNTLVF